MSDHPVYTHTITVKPGDTVIIKCPGMNTMGEQKKHLLFQTSGDEKLTIQFPALDP